MLCTYRYFSKFHLGLKNHIRVRYMANLVLDLFKSLKVKFDGRWAPHRQGFLSIIVLVIHALTVIFLSYRGLKYE